MLFNSHNYLLLFFPAALAVYYATLRWRPQWLHPVTTFTSLAFIFAGGLRSTAILAVSVTVNYFLLRLMRPGRRAVLAVGIAFNLTYLAYFKYAFFVTSNLAMVFPGIPLLAVMLPIGISFYTFQKITALHDCYLGRIQIGGFWDYALFVTFFPQLIAGPIVHYGELMPQFQRLDGLRGVIRRRALGGLALLAIGLGKKVLLADYFAAYVDSAFAAPGTVGAAQAWQGALSYSFQIYFDFSGYVDMAIGTARCFGILLPPNFDSPYQSASFTEFWHRWHITLSRFLRDYVYIPLGGSRAGAWRQAGNLMLTMTVGGLWHGAAWGFILWGVLHGLLLCINHAVNRRWAQPVVPRLLAIPAVFIVVTLLWVPFRAMHLRETLQFWRRMADLPQLATEIAAWLRSLDLAQLGHPGTWLYDDLGVVWLAGLVLTLVLLWFTPTSERIVAALEERCAAGRNRDRVFAGLAGMAAGALLAAGILVLNMHKATKFIYFQF